MIKKSLLLTVGSIIFVIGLVLFPLPVPFGLPTMILGLAILFKASNRVKRKVIWLLDKNHHTRIMWKKVKTYRRQKRDIPNVVILRAATVADFIVSRAKYKLRK